jgi:hypothetical protein
MADVSKIFKPRRGKVSTMLGTKASTVLAAGEMFFEVPDTGVGTGRGRIMLGDGSTTYVNLAGANNNTKGANSQAGKYFFPFTEDETIIHPGTSDKTVSASSSISSSTVATYLNNAKSGNTLKSIIHNLRQAIYTNACDIAMLNNDLAIKQNKFSVESWTLSVANNSANPSCLGGYFGTKAISSATKYNATKWSNGLFAFIVNVQSSSNNGFLGVAAIQGNNVVTNGPNTTLTVSMTVVYKS